MRWFVGTLIVTLAATTAVQASVFLNGVNVDGVVNQTFENCTVKIDEKGNVRSFRAADWAR